MNAAVSINYAELQARLTLEDRLTAEWGFGLTTASPLQRALCRIIDGRSLEELAVEPTVTRALAGMRPQGAVRPREVAILSGIRVGKSLLAAATAVHWTQTCDLSKLGAGEIPRISVVSLTKDLADGVLGHLLGRVQQSSVLSQLVVGEPSSDTVHLRHPSGRVVQIKVVAGSRAGASLVARWSAGCIFDEFPRMVGGSDGVVNWNDSRDAVLLRLLPGAQLVHIGSPWAPDGPAYDLVMSSWGKPSRHMVVVKASAPDMNPHYWTQERIDEAKSEPDVYRTDVLAEFSTPEEALYSAELVQKAVREEQAPIAGARYTAAMDPATRGNGWTFGIFTREGKDKRMVLAREWVGSRHDPLSPRDVLRDIATYCKRYDVRSIDTDQYHVDSLQDLARDVGIGLVQVPLTEREKTERYMGIRTKLAEGEIGLLPEVRADLLRLRKRVTQNGVQIVLPRTQDGRHCDFAPTVMLGLGRYLVDIQPKDLETPADKEVKRMFARAAERYIRPKPEPWED